MVPNGHWEAVRGRESVWSRAIASDAAVPGPEVPGVHGPSGSRWSHRDLVGVRDDAVRRTSPRARLGPEPPAAAPPRDPDRAGRRRQVPPGRTHRAAADGDVLGGGPRRRRRPHPRRLRRRAPAAAPRRARQRRWPTWSTSSATGPRSWCWTTSTGSCPPSATWSRRSSTAVPRWTWSSPVARCSGSRSSGCSRWASLAAARRSTTTSPRRAQVGARLCGCSWTGPRRSTRPSASPRTTCDPWSTCARRSTACPWPSSSPQPGCGSSRPRPCSSGSRTATGSSTARFRDVPARLGSLEASMQWSYDLCSPAEQLLWARLSVFVGGFGLPGAQRVCSGDGLDGRRIPALARQPRVAGASSSSTATVDPPHHPMLDSVREYGAARLAEHGGDGPVAGAARALVRRPGPGVRGRLGRPPAAVVARPAPPSTTATWSAR